MAKINKTSDAHDFKDEEQEEDSSIAGGSENLYSHSGNQYGSENWEFIYLGIL